MTTMTMETRAMLKRILLSVSLIASAAIAVSARTPEAETRTHYVISTRDRVAVYRATVIRTSSEQAGTETYLIENPAGQKVRIDIRRNFRNRLVTAEYSVNDGKPVKVKLELPGNATTRSEALKEMRERPELRHQDIPVTVESLGRVVKTTEREWQSGKADVRANAKAIAGAAFVSAIRPLASILGFPQFGGACSTFGFVSDGEKCVGTTSIMIAVDRPDCEFDARFGMPCDSAQKLRAKKQPENGKVASY
jgi:hypothetical protein